jgi:HK97 family phage major capsid protein
MDNNRLAELQTALKSRIDQINEGSQKAIKVEGTNVTVEQKDADALRGLMAECKDIELAIKAETYGEKAADFLRTPGPVEGGSAAMAAQFTEVFGTDPLQGKDLGRAFLDSDEFKAMKESGAYTMAMPFEAAIADLPSSGYGQKDVYTGMVSGINPLGFGTIQRDPMIPRRQRTTRVRDLFNVARTNANLIDYFKVTGFLENGGKGNAGSVAERDGSAFALKPKSNLAFTSAQAPVRTIAHWEAAHRNVLADEPQLQATINNELLYGLALEEDRQILQGTGLNEELEGLLVVSGTQSYTQTSGGSPVAATETKADAVRRAITRVLLANYDAQGVVLNPLDWEDIELTKSTTGEYILVANVAIGAEQRLWRQPVVATPAMPEGTFVTGAFGLGVQLYDREQANIRIAEQHADFFVRNAVAILAEERLAMAVKRPESVVVGTFF